MKPSILTTIALILLSLVLTSCSNDHRSTRSESYKPASLSPEFFDSPEEYERYLEDEYNSYISDQMYNEDNIKARWHN